MTKENVKERITAGKQVIIVDDDIRWANDLREFCEGFGHQIVGIAHSLEEAEMLIGRIHEGSAKIDLALLDGNLSKYSSGGSDGEYLADIVREQFPHAAIISISVSKQEWSDRPDLSSAVVDLEDLLEAIKNI